MVNVSQIKSSYVVVEPTHIKKSTKFTCMGWINKLQIPDEYPLCLLAVSAPDGLVQTDQAIRFEIKRSGEFDYRLQFSNSQSMPIEQYTDVSLNDNRWHLITYVCYGEGEMHYYVDGVECPSDTDSGVEGLPYSIAWSRYPRLGGGDVWVPYLYRDWQTLVMYKWRYASGLVLHKDWINELKDLEDPN